MTAAQTLDVALYAPQRDSHGLRDAWASPGAVTVDGWAPTRNDQPIEGNRRPIETEREVYPLDASGAGGPRARWTFPDGVFEQIGHADDYGHGPWWAGGAAFVVYLRRVEG